MIEVTFNTTNYTTLLQQIAASFKTSIKDDQLKVPLAFGTGLLWSESLPCEISIFFADCKLSKDIVIKRTEKASNVYSLQFNEIYTESKKQGVANEVLLQSFVSLIKVHELGEYNLPANVRLRTLRFYFSLEQLNQLIDPAVMDALFNYELLQKLIDKKTEIIDVVYKPILDELITAQFSQPLRINFLQNRILLLLEKFMFKQHKVQEMSLKKRMNANELERLIQVESLLLKDFSVAPPTIDKLAQISAMSATKLKNEFKTLFGSPIYEYFQKNRMAKAKSLLLEGSHTSKEVGMMVGYSNLSHFAAAFKKEYSISPSDLLAKNIKNN